MAHKFAVNVNRYNSNLAINPDKETLQYYMIFSLNLYLISGLPNTVYWTVHCTGFDLGLGYWNTRDLYPTVETEVENSKTI